MMRYDTRQYIFMYWKTDAEPP